MKKFLLSAIIAIPGMAISQNPNTNTNITVVDVFKMNKPLVFLVAQHDTTDVYLITPIKEYYAKKIISRYKCLYDSKSHVTNHELTTIPIFIDENGTKIDPKTILMFSDVRFRCWSKE
ncbi:MAG: hypothetical protein ACRC78_05625 [Planktothrix sp.]